MDNDLAAMNSRLPNLHTRLLAACDAKVMNFNEAEKQQIKNRDNRLKIQYAEFLFLEEKFDEAQNIFEMLEKDDALPVKALAWVGIADCIEVRADDNAKAEAAKWYKKVLGVEKLKKTDIYARAMYRYGLSLFGTVPGQTEAFELYTQYAALFPEGRNIRAVNFHRIRFLYMADRKAEANRLFAKFSDKKDGYTMYLRDLFAGKHNIPKEEKK